MSFFNPEKNAQDKTDVPKDKAADGQKLQPPTNKESLEILKKADIGGTVPDSIGKAEVVDNSQKQAATDTTEADKTPSSELERTKYAHAERIADLDGSYYLKNTDGSIFFKSTDGPYFDRQPDGTTTHYDKTGKKLGVDRITSAFDFSSNQNKGKDKPTAGKDSATTAAGGKDSTTTAAKTDNTDNTASLDELLNMSNAALAQKNKETQAAADTANAKQAEKEAAADSASKAGKPGYGPSDADSTTIAGKDSTATTAATADSTTTASKDTSTATTASKDSTTTAGKDSSATTTAAAADSTTTGGKDSSATTTAGKDSTTTAGKDSSVTTTASADSTTTAGKDSSATTTASKDSTTTAGKDSSVTTTASADSTTTAGKDSSATTTASKDSTTTSGKDSSATSTASKDSTTTAAKDTTPALTDQQKAVAEFTAAGATALQKPDGSTLFIKDKHVIGVITASAHDSDIIHYTYDGDQLTSIKQSNYEATRLSHKDGAVDQWQLKDGTTMAMNVKIDQVTGDSTGVLGDGSSKITRTDGSSIEFFPKTATLAEYTVEHTTDNVTITRGANGKISEVDYPQNDPKAPVLSRKFHYNDKGTMDGYVASNGSAWTSTDGMHWLQVTVNEKGETVPNFHKDKQGKLVQASFTGPIALGNDGSFKHVALGTADKDGNPEEPHLTAYDKFGNKVLDTPDKKNFHAEIAKYCQDYVQDFAKKTGGKPVTATAIANTLNDANTSGTQKVAALFLQRMLPAKSNYTAGVEPSVDSMAANTWLATAKNQDSAAIEIARAFAGADSAQPSAQDTQIATNKDSTAQPASDDQETVAQTTDQTPQPAAAPKQVEAPKQVSTEPTVDQNPQAAASDQKQAVDLAKQSVQFFNDITNHTGRPVSRQYLQQIANSPDYGPDSGKARIANYLLELMPPQMPMLTKGFIADLVQRPQLPSKEQIAQVNEELNKQSNN